MHAYACLLRKCTVTQIEEVVVLLLLFRSLCKVTGNMEGNCSSLMSDGFIEQC